MVVEHTPTAVHGAIAPRGGTEETTMSKRIIRDILTQARTLIDTPEKWCQGAFARDERNNEVESYDRTAVRFCAIGAIRNAARAYDSLDAETEAECLLAEALDPAAHGYCAERVYQVNDSREEASLTTHRLILDAFTRAIERALREDADALIVEQS